MLSGVTVDEKILVVSRRSLSPVTTLYDQLVDHPRTKVNPSRLNYDERTELRHIKVLQSTDLTNKGGSGRFTTVYYLDGDEERAAEVFVEENRAQLEGIDFSKKDVVQRAVSREVYDWILHALGERELEKYESVVRETRPEGPTWVIQRDHYETYPNRRYSPRKQAVRITEISLEELYEAFDDVITWSDLEDYDTVDGDARYILEYYRVSEDFVCDPVTHDGGMAVRKR